MEGAHWPLQALEASVTHMTSGTFPWLELLLTARSWKWSLPVRSRLVETWLIMQALEISTQNGKTV